LILVLSAKRHNELQHKTVKVWWVNEHRTQAAVLIDVDW